MRDLCELACREPLFDLCDVEHNPRLGNASVLYPILWRFLPVIDVQVDLFLSRDLDSRINPREVSNISKVLCRRECKCHLTKIKTFSSGVDKVRLAGQIRPAVTIHTACGVAFSIKSLEYFM